MSTEIVLYMFRYMRYGLPMDQTLPDPALMPTTPEELAKSLSYALRFNGRKRVTVGDELLAQIVAERLVEYLEQAGYVVMKRPPKPLHSAP